MRWEDFVDTEGVVDFLRELIQIPSENPLGDTRQIAQVVLEKCSKLGLESRVIGKDKSHANVWSVLKGRTSGPTILFNGHIDTVPVGSRKRWHYDPFGGEVHSGRIYGRGASDMLGGIVAMIMAVDAIQKTGIKLAGNVILTCVSDEETGGALGTGYLLERGLAADVAICAEPSDLNLCLAHSGVHWIRITTKGKPAHASMPAEGVNAIEMMAKIIGRINKVELVHKRHKLLHGPLVSPATTIRGGTKTNVIPELCTATFDVRTVPGQIREQIIAEIREFIMNLSEEAPQLKAEVETVLWSEPGEISEKENIVKIASRAIKNITGEEPKIFGTRAGGDARLLINQGSIPTIPMLGPGSMKQAHKADEYIEISNLINATKIFAEIIREYLRRA